jgi:hypothetical protein
MATPAWAMIRLPVMKSVDPAEGLGIQGLGHLFGREIQPLGNLGYR